MREAPAFKSWTTFYKLKNAVQHDIGSGRNLEYTVYAGLAGKTDFQSNKCIFGTTALFACFFCKPYKF